MLVQLCIFSLKSGWVFVNKFIYYLFEAAAKSGLYNHMEKQVHYELSFIKEKCFLSSVLKHAAYIHFIHHLYDIQKLL